MINVQNPGGVSPITLTSANVAGNVQSYLNETGNSNTITTISQSLLMLPVKSSVHSTVVSKDNSANSVTLKTSTGGTVTFRTNLPLNNGDQVELLVLEDEEEGKLKFQINSSSNPEINVEADIVELTQNTSTQILETDILEETPEIGEEVMQLMPGKIIKGNVANPKLATLASILEQAIGDGNIELVKNIIEYVTTENVNEQVLREVGKVIDNLKSELLPVNIESKPFIADFKIVETEEEKAQGNISADKPEANKQSKTEGLPLTGKIINLNNGKESFLQTPLGFIKMPPNLHLAENTELTVVLKFIHPVLVSNINQEVNHHSLVSTLINHWHALDEALNEIEHNLPSKTHNISKNVFPATDTQLAAKMMTFITSVKGENVVEWLGQEIVRELKKIGKDNLLNEINRDFASLKELMLAETKSSTAQQQNWHTYLVPIHDGQDINHTSIYVKDQKDHEKSKNDQEKTTRFVIEMSTEFAGNIQLDGLVRYVLDPVTGTYNKNFDMFVRSTEDMPAEVSKGIEMIFKDSSDITGIKGGVIFQTTEKFPINPEQDVINGMHKNSGFVV